jgi:hypothetical protein
MESFLTGLSSEHKFWLAMMGMSFLSALAAIAMLKKIPVSFLGVKLNYKKDEDDV